MDLSLLNNVSQAKVLVVGDVMLDRYWLGDTGRISPEAPVPVVKINQLEDKAGGAANVAKNIAHLDGQVSLLGIVGDDEYGKILQDLLVNENIESQLVVQKEHPTIAKMRVISRHQQVVRLDVEDTFTQAHSQLLLERLQSIISEHDFVLFSDYNKGSLTLIEQMIEVAKTAGKTVLIDPKSKDLRQYAGADFITPNLSEFTAAGGETGSEQIIVDSARRIIASAGIGAMLLTRSEQGMTLITNKEKHDFPAQVQEVAATLRRLPAAHRNPQ